MSYTFSSSVLSYIPLKSSNHSVRTNFGNDNLTIIFIGYRHFGLVGRGLEEAGGEDNSRQKREAANVIISITHRTYLRCLSIEIRINGQLSEYMQVIKGNVVVISKIAAFCYVVEPLKQF